MGAYGQSSRHVPIGPVDLCGRWPTGREISTDLQSSAEMEYEGVELTQYERWTLARAKEVRTLLDGIRVKVFATTRNLNTSCRATR